MRFINTAAVLLGLAASVCAAPKPTAKPVAKMDAKAGAAECTKTMKAKGMDKNGQCSMTAKDAKTSAACAVGAKTCPMTKMTKMTKK